MENDCKVITPKKTFFRQHSENFEADIVIVHEPSTEIFLSMLHPAASLYSDVTNEQEVKLCFERFSKILDNLNIKMLSVRELLKLNKEGLISLALRALTYECDNEEEGKNNPDFLYYISDEYKRSVLDKLTLDQLVDVVLTTPTYRLKYVPRNTYVEPINITFRPLGNLLFVRDQQITTQRGVVIGRTMNWARELEHLIMHQVFKNLHVEVIGEIPPGAYLEGGDFYVAKPDLSIIGIGARSNFKAAAYLMKNDLLGTERLALVVDENDFCQQRMHLDTFFNILNEKNVVCIDFEDISKVYHRNINRKVFIYTKVSSKPYIRTNNDKELVNKLDEGEDLGEYTLNIIFDDFYSFLDSEDYNTIKISHQHQSDYMINFLNVGNNTVISVNKELKDVLREKEVNVNVIDLNFDAVVKMYGAVHCATQVARKGKRQEIKDCNTFFDELEPEKLIIEDMKLDK